MFTYENQGADTFIVYRLNQEDQVDSIGLSMFANNKIRNFVPIHFFQQDEERYLKYNVSTKVSVTQFFAGSVSKKSLLGLLSSVCAALLEAEEYLLMPSSLVLDPQYIFVDVTSREASLLCLPLKNRQKSTMDMRLFFREIVSSTQFDQNENNAYVATIINALNSTTLFSTLNFKRIVDELKKAEDKQAQAEPQSAAPPIEKPPVPPPAPAPRAPSPAPDSGPARQIPNKPYGGNNPGHQRMLEQMYAEETKDDKQGAISNFIDKLRGKSGQLTPEQMNRLGGDQPHTPPGRPSPDGMSQPGQKAPFIQPLQPSAGGPPRRPPTSSGGKPRPPLQPVFSKPTAPQPARPSPTSPPPAPSASQQAYNAPKQSDADFGDTTLLNTALPPGTTVLGAGAPSLNTPYLIRKKNNEKIPINKPVFRIGKESNYVDYYIGDNSTISRSHANILLLDGQYFIEDQNSTNHTYVNNKILKSNVQVQLEHGSQLRLANEYFDFYLY